MLLHGDWRSRALVLAVVSAIIFGALPSATAQPRRAVTPETIVIKLPTKRRRTGPGLLLHSSPWRITRPARPSPAQIALSVARAQLGKPYQWAASGPSSFDCSGLMMFAWHAAGVDLSHNSYAQQDETKAVPVDKMQPGDLVFYPGHVGMYIGHGEMIHAPHTGANVEIAPLQSDIIGAGRPA